MPGEMGPSGGEAAAAIAETAVASEIGLANVAASAPGEMPVADVVGDVPGTFEGAEVLPAIETALSEPPSEVADPPGGDDSVEPTSEQTETASSAGEATGDGLAPSPQESTTTDTGDMPDGSDIVDAIGEAAPGEPADPSDQAADPGDGDANLEPGDMRFEPSDDPTGDATAPGEPSEPSSDPSTEGARKEPVETMTLEQAKARLRDQAANGEIPTGRHGVALWSGPESVSGADQIAAERTASGDKTITIGETPMGKEMSAADARVKELSDPTSYRENYEAERRPAWTIASQRLVASATGRVDVVVPQEAKDQKTGEVKAFEVQDTTILMVEALRACNKESVSEIRFHEMKTENAIPVKDADGKFVIRELMRRDW